MAKMTTHWLITHDGRLGGLCGYAGDDRNAFVPGTNFVDQIPRINCEECRQQIESHMRQIAVPSQT